jgi:hypothetical protein
MTEMEFFDGLDLRKFYTIVRSGSSLEHAILRAVRREDGYEARVERRDGVLEVRLRGPIWGRAVKVFKVPANEIPRAWRWWEPPERRRAWRMVFEEPDGTFAYVEGPVIGPEVYCDTCGTLTEIRVRPVPVLLGTDAVCPRCFEALTGLPLEEAARMDGVALREAREAQT